MKKIAYILAFLLLLFNGAGAVYGGWALMTDPSGHQIALPLETLGHTPFPDFLIPGIVLFNCLGLFSLLAIFSMLFAMPYYQQYILAEGCLLTGWIVIQYLWTHYYHPLQLVMGLAGLMLVACGWILSKKEGKMICA